MIDRPAHKPGKREQAAGALPHLGAACAATAAGNRQNLPTIDDAPA